MAKCLNDKIPIAIQQIITEALVHRAESNYKMLAKHEICTMCSLGAQLVVIVSLLKQMKPDIPIELVLETVMEATGHALDIEMTAIAVGTDFEPEPKNLLKELLAKRKHH